VNAVDNENKTTISYIYKDTEIIQEFILEGSIITTELSKEATEETMTKAIETIILTDAVGQLHGYKDVELFDTLNSEQAESYSVEEGGMKTPEN